MKENKLVVLVGPAHPLRGGIAHFNESFAKELIKQGYHVKLVSFYLQYPSLLFPGKSQKTDSPPPFDLEIHNMISSINPKSWRKTANKISAWNPMMVVIRFWLPFMGPSLGTIAKQLQRKKVKVIGLVDNAIPHESRIGDSFLSGWFFRNCNGFFTLSEQVANDLKKIRPGTKVETSPHPLYDIFGQKTSREEALDHLGLSDKYKYILFFGFVRKYKGLDLLLEGFAKSGLADKKIRVLVAGEFYEDRTTYDQLIEKLQLTHSVIIKDDYIPESEVRYFFGAANLVAQTYKSATQSGVAQIAFHFDKPMLATEVGGLPEIVDDGLTGLVVQPNPQAIAEGLRRFFEEESENSFIPNIQRAKQRFTWPHFCSQFFKFAETI